MLKTKSVTRLGWCIQGAHTAVILLLLQLSHSVAFINTDNFRLRSYVYSGSKFTYRSQGKKSRRIHPYSTISTVNSLCCSSTSIITNNSKTNLSSAFSGDNITDESTEKELVAAVEEVKGAAMNVTSSAGQLTSAVVSNGPLLLRSFMKYLLAKELWDDFRRRRDCYKSDWTDALSEKRKCIPAVLFLYFACLAPVVSFGTIASQITEGSLGVVEFLIASGGAGMLYAIMSGQPMAFIAPTGLTLAFISGLFRFCSLQNVAFFPVYTWVGLWTSFFMILLGSRGASKMIRFCTRFTDEVFNGLLSLNFVYEAYSSLRRNFSLANPLNLSMPFVSLSLALGTFWFTEKVNWFHSSIYFNEKIRTLAKDFGPVAVIIAFSALNSLRLGRYGVPTLAVPSTFQLAGGREFLVPLLSIPSSTRILCVFPALLLTGLFFMDQNISVRGVNNPDNHLKKGEAYNIDMIALGIITAVLSIFGLPWMCGATVQSIKHVKAMTTTKFDETTGKLEVEKVTETRVTGFLIHGMLAATLKLLPMLRFLPIPVVSGVFLYLGRKLMTGNTFLKRIKDGCAEKKRLPDDHPINILGRKKMNIFTSVQVLCLIGLWTFKQNSSTAIFFPSVIGMLMAIRSFILPRFFSEEEFVALGDPSPS